MKVLLIAALSVITAASAFAQYNGGYGGGYGNQGMQNERIQLHIQDHLQGQNIIKLKQELKFQHPGINIQNLKLKAVKLVAKSRMGRGQATLLVGQSASYPAIVGGNPRDFDYGGPQSFDQIRIQNPSYTSQGKWQIETRGNVKVKKVVLIVEKQFQQMGQTIILRTNGQHLQGLNTLKLKQMIKMQNPRIDLQTAKIESVILMAKSRMGRGQATLLVGQSASYPATIAGTPRGFDTYSPRSFSQVVLQNPSYDSFGKWQIELRGNIKVQRILVKIKSQGQSHWDYGHYNPRPRRRRY